METYKIGFVTENVKRILDEVAQQSVKWGRSTEEIRVMAVTKTVQPEYVNEAIAAGIGLLGENKSQELCSKYDSYQKEKVDIHFIGHLQTNKVKMILPKVSMIESVDSVGLAAEINRQMNINLSNKKMDILIEVNIGKEKNKSGIIPERLDELLLEIAEFQQIQVRGLMTIPPVCENMKETEYYFNQMCQLFIDIKQKKLDNINMDFLSMGMSQDYIQAIKYGSNILRVGTAMFGQRNGIR